ncbi:Lsr2 family DNA-binding protein [Streptomyces yunnanensis]
MGHCGLTQEHQVSHRGRVPGEVREAYAKAH